METTTNTGASAPVSSPASTPSAAPPAATGATPAPAATTPSPSAPATDPGSGSPSTPDANQSDIDFISSRLRDGFGIDKDGNPKPAGEELPGDNGEVQVPPAGEEEGADGTQGAGDGTEENSFDDFTLNPSGFTGAKELSEKIAADPVLKQALDANHELKDRFFANARLAERASQYDEIVGSPDEARVAIDGYQAFASLGERMSGIQEGNFETLDPFLDALKEQTALRDENGEIVRNPDGSVKTDGTAGRFLKTYVHGRLELWAKDAVQKGDEELLAALDTVMERAGLRAPSSAAEDELSEELKSQKSQIEQEKKQLDERKQQQFQADLQASDARVDSRTDQVLEGALKSILDSADGLDQFTRDTLENNIRKELSRYIRSSTSYRNQRAAIERMPMGASREQRVVQLNTRFVNEHLRRIASDAITKAGVSIQTKAEQRKQRQEARTTASRSDTNSAMAPATAPSGQADFVSIPKIEADLKQKLGREASTQEVLAERMLRMRQAQPAR